MSRWDRIAENRMRKAALNGGLTGLQGEGKPLPDRPENALIDPGLAVGARIMAEAGALPREITVKKQIIEAQEEYAAETDPAKRKALMAKLADLQTRHGMEADARRKFLGS